MKTSDMENGNETAITAEELDAIVQGLNCPVGVKTRLANIIDCFPNAQAFMDADKSALRMRGRCGARLLKLIGEVRERWYVLKSNRESRFRLCREFAKFIDEREKVHAREIALLDPVFSEKDLQVAMLFMGEEKLEYVDLRRLNEMRYAITAGERQKLKERYEREKEERTRLAVEAEERREREASEQARRIAEEVARIQRGREEPEEKEKPKRKGRKEKAASADGK